MTTSTTAPITSTLPSPVTKSLNLERFWRLTAAPKTIRLSRPESNTQGDRRPLESNIRLLATTEPNQPTRLLRTSMGPSELSWSTTGPQQEIPTIGGSSVQFSQSQFGQGIPESAFNPQNQFGQTRFSLGPSPFQFQQDPQIQQVPETFRQGLNGFQPLQQQRTFEPSQFPPFLLNPPQPTVLPPEHRGVVSNFFGEQNGTVQHQQTLINNLQPNNDIIQPQSFTPRPTFVSPSSHVPQFSNEISRLNPTILQLTGTSHSPRLLQQFPVGFDQRERSNFGPPQNPEVQFNQDRSWPGSQTTH